MSKSCHLFFLQPSGKGGQICKYKNKHIDKVEFATFPNFTGFVAAKSFYPNKILLGVPLKQTKKAEMFKLKMGKCLTGSLHAYPLCSQDPDTQNSGATENPWSTPILVLSDHGCGAEAQHLGLSLFIRSVSISELSL